MTIRVALVDDHQLMRQGLRSILEKESDIEVVGEAAGGRDGVQLVDDLTPDIVIMDVAMADLNGVQATRMIKTRWPRTGVIALSSHSDRHNVLSVLDAGADAYVLKAGAFEELKRAVRAVRGGQRYLSPEIAGIVVEESLAKRNPAPEGERGSSLSLLGPREREVLQLVAEGLTSGEIARRLSLTQSTVDTHRRNLMKKLGLHNVADVTRFAIREGLTSFDA